MALVGLALAGCGGGSSGTGEESANAAGSESIRQITIATNPAGTHVYAVAAGLAKLIQEDQGIRTTIQPFCPFRRS